MPSITGENNSTADEKKRKVKDGIIYETIGLALLGIRGLNSKKKSEFLEFGIGKEIGIGKDAKFDDLVFQYSTNQDESKNLILIQMKHIENDYLINSVALKAQGGKGTGNMKRDFNLQKYFISYLNVREELKVTTSKELKNGKIEYVAIFTNVGLDTKELAENEINWKKGLPKILNILNFKDLSSKAQGYIDCYQLCTDNENLRKILKKSSYLHRLAKIFAQNVLYSGNYEEREILSIDKSPVKHYHVALEREVFKKINLVENKQYWDAQFRYDFLDNNITGSKKELRDAIFEAIRELEESKREMNNEELICLLKEEKFKLHPNFGKTKKNKEINLPNEWNTIKDKDITDFLNCLVFIVNQPKVKELENILIRSTHSTVIEHMVEDMPLKEVFDALQKAGTKYKEFIEDMLGNGVYKGKWIFSEDIKNVIEEVKQLISISLRVIAISLNYESEVMQYGTFNEYGKIREKLDIFLQSKRKLLCINISETLLSSIKILQYLNTVEGCRAEDGRISINLTILKSKEIRDCMVKTFALESIKLVLIECRHADNKEDLEFCLKLAKLKLEKRIIFIMQQDMCNKLTDKLRNEESIFLENDSVNLKDFKPKVDPITKDLLVFQGQKRKTSLAKLTDIYTWDSFVKSLPKEICVNEHDILMTLLKMLNNEEIEIGSKPLGTTSLDGAYATLFEENNKNTLANKLLLQNTNEMYVISGISGSDREDKLNNLISYLELTSKKDVIENQFGGDCKIQIVDDQFKDENFQELCHNHPDNLIFWICLKDQENTIKFILQQFYNPKFYLKRKFKNCIFNKEIVNDNQYKFAGKHQKEENEDNCDAEATFKEMCTEIQNDDQLIRFVSHGSLGTLRRTIHYKQTESSLVEEKSFITEIKDKKVVIITDDPGMGKTTTLTKLYESRGDSKSFVETHWVIKIILRDHLQAIRNLKIQDHDNGMENAVSFLSEIDFKLKSNFVKCLLGFALDKHNSFPEPFQDSVLDQQNSSPEPFQESDSDEQNSFPGSFLENLYKHKSFSKPLLLAFDGYDEILNEQDREKVILLLKFFKNKTAAKLWITTRLHYKEILENELSTSATEFNPMNDEVKVEYIRKYLKDRLYLILSEEEFSELFDSQDGMTDNKIIKKYTAAFLNKMKLVFKDDIFRFIGTPLQLYLMLEGSVKYFKDCIEKDNCKHFNFDYLGSNVCEIYKKFINRKYDIYFQKIEIRNCIHQKQYKFILNQYYKDYAKSLLLESRFKKPLEKFKDVALSAGIMKSPDSNIDNAEFIHTTFRDYFAAKLFIYWIKNMGNELPNTNKQEYLLKEVLKKSDYRLIRTFINIKLQKILEHKLLKEILNQYGKICEKLLKQTQNSLIDEKGTALHIAVIEDNNRIAWFLINSLKYSKDILKEFLFVCDEFGNTALHLACIGNNKKIVKMLLNAARRISPNTVQEYIYLLTTREWACNTLDIAIGQSTGIFKEILKRANNKVGLILDGKKSHSSLTLACERENKEFVKILLKEFEHDEESIKNLLLDSDRDCNALYYAAHCSDIVEIILSYVRKIKDNDETLKMLLLPEDEYTSPLNQAVRYGNKDVVEKLINTAKEINDGCHTLKQMLLDGNSTENSAFLRAAEEGRWDILKLLLKTAVSEDSAFLEKLILSADHCGNTAIHLILELFHGQTLSNDITQKSAFHNAAEEQYWVIFKLLLNTADSLGSAILEKFIFAVNKDGKNAVYLIVENQGEDMFYDFLRILEEDKYDDIRKKVFETYHEMPLKDKLCHKRSMLINLVANDQIENVKDILDRAKSSSNHPNEKLQILLSFPDSIYRRGSSFYVACENCRLDIIKEMLSYAININDEGKTLKKLIASSSHTKTPFETLKNGIVERLILEAKNNNNEPVVNILEKYNTV